MKQLYVMTTPLRLDADAIPECVSRQIDGLKNAIEQLELSEILRNRTRGFQKALSEAHLDKIGVSWGKSPALSSSSPMAGKSITNFDGSGHCDGACSARHKINYVLCLNNREATGTNFLKLELGAMDGEARYGFEHTYGVLICLSRVILERGGWDPSYADSLEYEHAYKHAYAPLLSAKSLMLEIHSP